MIFFIFLRFLDSNQQFRIRHFSLFFLQFQINENLLIFYYPKNKVGIKYFVSWSDLLNYKERVVEKFVEIDERELKIFETTMYKY